MIANPDPFVFTAFGFGLRWYSALAGVSFLSAFLSYRFCSSAVSACRTDPVPQSRAAGLFTGLAISGTFGAKLAYAAFYSSTGQVSVVFGASFFGFLLGASGFLAAYCSMFGYSFFSTADRLAVYLPISLAFVRLGNFANGEL